ncbi:RusA family crossover junction endodeoxyribonuclease [Acetoanaerobium sticklandii]|uniref:RusA family crossover junction endodeoxyribonuclease n=1 Tax=Acetoanaerobium sticklandii TaxID=1511 RepID=UPI003A90A47A
MEEEISNRKTYKLTIPGEPIAKGRPRVTKWGTHTPEKTKNYEMLVRELYFHKNGQTLLSGELYFQIDTFFKIPKSTSKIKALKMENKELRPTKRPDIDNILKSITDSLNGVAYEDDSQIVEVLARKYYSSSPRVEITMYEIRN